jgi:hypothetical protein
MFKRMLQTSSAQGRMPASAEEPHQGLSTPTVTERSSSEPPPMIARKLPTFEEIYRKASSRSTLASTEYNVLKVAEMVNSDQLRGLSPGAKHCALLMALEAASVAVEDILQDAVQRQRALNDQEEIQRQRLEDFEKIKLAENQRIAAEMEEKTAQYRARIAAGIDEIERERAEFRAWQENKAREHRRIAEAAAACVSDDSGLSSEASVTRLLEKNATSLRQSA